MTRETAITVAAAWLAFIAGLLAGGEIRDFAALAIASATGAVLVVLGFAAVLRCRTLPRRSNVRKTRLALLSLGAGMALGVANLGANLMIAAAHPVFGALMVERTATVAPPVGVVAARSSRRLPSGSFS